MRALGIYLSFYVCSLDRGSGPGAALAFATRACTYGVGFRASERGVGSCLGFIRRSLLKKKERTALACVERLPGIAIAIYWGFIMGLVGSGLGYSIIIATDIAVLANSQQRALAARAAAGD